MRIVLGALFETLRDMIVWVYLPALIVVGPVMAILYIIYKVAS